MVDSLQVTRVGGVVRDVALTPERILDAVSEQLELSGIAALRLRDVAERLHVSVPSLYRFFEDREAMIAAAYVRDFAAQTFRDLDELTEVFSSAESKEDYERGLRALLGDVMSEERRRSRWRKLAAMAATRHDPALTSQINAVQAEFTDQVAELFAQATARGWVTTAVSPLAFAFAVQGLALGPLFADLSPAAGVDGEEFLSVVLLFHRALTA